MGLYQLRQNGEDIERSWEEEFYFSHLACLQKYSVSGLGVISLSSVKLKYRILL